MVRFLQSHRDRRSPPSQTPRLPVDPYSSTTIRLLQRTGSWPCFPRGDLDPESRWCRLASREEECITLSILPWTLRVVFLWVKIDPYAGRINVLVTLVPSPVDDFCVVRVFIVSFQLFIRYLILLVLLLVWSCEWIVRRVINRRRSRRLGSCRCRLVGKIEQDAFMTSSLLRDELVEVKVLPSGQICLNRMDAVATHMRNDHLSADHHQVVDANPSPFPSPFIAANSKLSADFARSI